MSEEAKSATVRISPGAVKIFLKGYEELKASLKADLDDSHRTADRIVKITELRNAFYEKLVLLAGGSFALSLTFLGSLRRSLGRESHVNAMWCLEISWGLLLLCIFLSWLHNRHRTGVAESATAALAGRARSHYNRQQGQLFSNAGSVFDPSANPDLNIRELFEAAAKLLDKGAEEADQQARDLKNSIAESWKIAHTVGNCALLSRACAFFLMLIFALANASLL